MPFSPMTSILRQTKNRHGEPLNILTFPTHERYETNLAKTGHNFYAIQADGIKDWKTVYAPVPENYVLLDKSLGNNQIPTWLDVDLVLSQNKFGQYQIGSQLARELHVPLVSLEHTLPAPQWIPGKSKEMTGMRGNINVFISDFSIEEWHFERTNDVRVVRHAVDSEVFKPDEFISGRENRIISVVNDWIGRNWCCNFEGWVRVTKDLPVFPVGDTANFSKPAKDVPELVSMYANSRIFINTSTISPVPSALLEAMSCGCACVTTATCMIPEIIENGVNGFLTNDEKEMRDYLELLLRDEDLATRLGQAARQTILDKFGLDRFVSEWNEVFYEAQQIPFIGV